MKHTLTLLLLSSTLLLANSSKEDPKSGLVWQDNQEVGQQSLSQEQAIAYCQKLEADGFEDWRLPTLREAYTIIDLNRNRPALKSGFEVRDDGRYWVATDFAKDPEKSAWHISLAYGAAEASKKDRRYAVRCVRGKIQK